MKEERNKLKQEQNKKTKNSVHIQKQLKENKNKEKKERNFSVISSLCLSSEV